MATLFDLSGPGDPERDCLSDWRDGISLARITWQDELGAEHLCVATERDPRGMIEAYRNDRIDPDYVCASCWGKRGNRPDPLVRFPAIPVAPDPLACLAASEHKTRTAAFARADKVAFHLGTRPEIHPREADAPTYWVVGDSPLVPGFKPAENPHK